MDYPGVFIGGFRSGTTLLINLLGQSPLICPWYETKELCEILRYLHVLRKRSSIDFENQWCSPPTPSGFTIEAVYERVRKNILDNYARMAGSKGQGKASYESYALGNDLLLYSQEEALSIFNEFAKNLVQLAKLDCIDDIFNLSGKLISTYGNLQLAKWQRFKTSHHSAQLWVNKTPEITRFGCELHECLGEVRCLYLVRDGLQVIASARRLGWASVKQLAYSWQHLLLETRQSMQNQPGNYLELHYEELIKNPKETLSKALEFCRPDLGKTTDEVLAKYLKNNGVSSLDISRIQPSLAMPSEDIDLFMEQAGELYTALGYNPP